MTPALFRIPLPGLSGSSGARKKVSLSPAALWGLATFAGCLLVLILRAWMPSESAESSICLFRRLGFSCPACGMTRALALLLRGQWAASVAHHPLAPLVAAEGVSLWLASGVLILSGRWKASSWTLINRLIVAHALLFFAVWIVRML